MEYKSGVNFSGEIELPSDKSITHRALIISSISNSNVEINNFVLNEDTESTLKIIGKLGIFTEHFEKNKKLLVKGKGLYFPKKPNHNLDCMNSGTTMRLLTGVLSGQKFNTILTGDSSLIKRPMKRIVDPLNQRGASISIKNGTAPIYIKGNSTINELDYSMNIVSAQVKSAILLSGLYSNGITKVLESVKTRNHTEIMLKYFGADISTINNEIKLNPGNKLKSDSLYIPGDISSAAFWILGALISKNSRIRIKNVGLNETRAHYLNVLKNMGGNILISNLKVINGEKVADILISSSELEGINMTKVDVAKCIDEIPVIAIAASLAKGNSQINGINELRKKESDRARAIEQNLKKLGAKCELIDDSIKIEGSSSLSGANLNSYDDHRIYMAFAIASAGLERGEISFKENQSYNISYRDFINDYFKLAKFN